MDGNRRSVLQRELEIYSGGLLKKHKTAKNHELTSSSVHQLSKNSSSYQLTFSGYRMVKNSTQQLASKFPYNKYNQTCISNQRTVLYNNNNNFKSKYKLTANKTARNSPFNEVKSQGTVSNKYPTTQSKQADLCSENSSVEASKLSSTSVKVSSKSRALIEEIESLTKMLKKTSENKTKAINSSIKNGSSMVKKLHNYKSSSSNFKYCAISKPNILENKGAFSKINDPFKNELKISCSNINSTVELRKKLSDFNQTNFISGKKSKNISCSAHLNSLNLDKYCYKKVNTERTLSSKATYSPLKTIDNEKNSNNNIEKSISQSRIQKVNSLDIKSVVAKFSYDISKLEMKTLNCESKLKLEVAAGPVMPRTKISNKYPDVQKSQNMHNSSCGAKVKCPTNKYKRVNTDHSVILSKSYRPKNASLRSPSIRRTKTKVNTKFKKINKTLPPCVNKKVVLDKNSFGCKENSPLAVDKSDPLFKILNDSTVDKLEKDLLAISTTLTSTPTSVKNYRKGLQNKSSKMIPKLSHKQMSLKKSKARISKYKVINSVASHNSAINKLNFANLKNIKKTKFSVINKCILPVHTTPVQQGKSVLIKRLFKSKNAIINKNVNSLTYHSAKMIKCKYFALNKRKLPFERLVSYSKVPFLKPKFKGYLSTKVYSKKNRARKSPIATYTQRTIRNFSRYGYNKRTAVFNRSVSCNNSKKKLYRGFGHSPEIFIRGHKYSLNSSGKTLRKLPVQDFSRIHQKVAFNNKRFVKMHENSVKAVTPTSANLASRVLHRSITRVLSASSKKKVIKVNSYCMFYNRFGRCNRGVKCTYIHDPSKIAVCTRFLRGTCKVDGCPFSHEIAPGKMAICSFFLVGACDKDNCPYRHENLSPDAELCKAFVQGYCPSGKECKKAHILICPKHIQGNCEKGTSCAFPHPPQKVRKNVQKETDEESKEDDALFEKVARYFQPNENTSLPCEKKLDDNAVIKVFVPKQRRLEEQPSFIPLSDSPILLNNSCKKS